MIQLLGVVITFEAYSCTILRNLKKWLFNFRNDILINTITTTLESNLRPSQSWNTYCICIMDWTFIKPSTVIPRFLPYHAYPTQYSNVQKWAKQHYYARGRNIPTHYHYRIATELAKADQYLLQFQ